MFFLTKKTEISSSCTQLEVRELRGTAHKATFSMKSDIDPNQKRMFPCKIQPRHSTPTVQVHKATADAKAKREREDTQLHVASGASTQAEEAVSHGSTCGHRRVSSTIKVHHARTKKDGWHSWRRIPAPLTTKEQSGPTLSLS